MLGSLFEYIKYYNISNRPAKFCIFLSAEKSKFVVSIFRDICVFCVVNKTFVSRTKRFATHFSSHFLIPRILFFLHAKIAAQQNFGLRFSGATDTPTDAPLELCRFCSACRDGNRRRSEKSEKHNTAFFLYFSRHRPRFLRISDHFPRRADVNTSVCFLLCLWKHVSTFSSQPTPCLGKRKAPLACLQKSRQTPPWSFADFAPRVATARSTLRIREKCAIRRFAFLLVLRCIRNGEPST